MPGHPFYSTPAWHAARLQCLRAHHWRCAWCGASVRRPGTSRVDHIKARAQHPELALVQANLRTLCVLCDARRHADKGGTEVDKRGTDAKGWPTDPAHHWNAKAQR